MEMITYKCPHCGANLQVGFGARRIVCDYCDSEVWIEDAATRAMDAEEEGYRFEKGRQRAKRESGYTGGQGTYTQNSGSYSYGGQTQGSTVNSQCNVNVNYMLSVSPKSRMIALLLCVFLGVFGVHRFYVGKIGTGILYLFTGSLFGFGYIFDIIMILIGSFRDKQGLPLKTW